LDELVRLPGCGAIAIVVGTHVEANIDGSGEFYAARVVRANADGTFCVRCDDDSDEEQEVHANDVRVHRDGPGVQVAASPALDDTRPSQVSPADDALLLEPRASFHHPPPTSLPMDDNWENCDAEAVVTALSVRYRFSRANAVQLLCGKDPRFRYLLQGGDEDEEEREHHDWVSPALAVRVLSVHYRFSGANAVQLLRDEGILRQRAETEHDDDDDDDVEEAPLRHTANDDSGKPALFHLDEHGKSCFTAAEARKASTHLAAMQLDSKVKEALNQQRFELPQQTEKVSSHFCNETVYGKLNVLWVSGGEFQTSGAMSFAAYRP